MTWDRTPEALTLKNILLAATIAAFGTQAIAGGFSDVVTEAPIVIVDEAGAVSSASGLIVPAILVALLLFAASGKSSGEEVDTTAE